jgi:xylulose-5-phosphate/fructose-6-phosphate phosphoketolase
MPLTSRTDSAKAVGLEHQLSLEELRKVHAYWRAANYISVGQIYLRKSPFA